MIDLNPTGSQIRERIVNEIDSIALRCISYHKSLNAYVSRKTYAKICSNFNNWKNITKLELSTRLGIVVTIIPCDALPDNVVDFSCFINFAV